MENPNPVIVDISSDDEASFGDAIEKDRDWLSELLLEEVDGGTNDSDDVVVIDEVICNTKKPRLNSSMPAVESVRLVSDDDGDDDACVILDGDPDKMVAIENGKVDDDDSDDLLLVGEKGQVACRDFAHPRHLCGNFRFASTPHNMHCNQCHCYVCDSLAPCAQWGSGSSRSDHCHATNKEEFWIAQRKSMKGSDQMPQILNKNYDTSFSTELSQTMQVPSLAPGQANYLTQKDDFSQIPVLSLPHCGVSNITIQGRRQPSVSVVPRSRCQPHWVPQQLSNTCSRNVISRDGRQNAGSRVPQFIRPCAVLKKKVDSVNERHGHGLWENNSRSHISRNPPLPRWRASHGHVNPTLNNHHSSNDMGSGRTAANFVSSQLNVSASPSTSNFVNYSVPKPQTSTQPPLSSQVANAIPPQTRVSSQPYIDSNFLNVVPSQAQIASKPNFKKHFQDRIIPQHQLGVNTFLHAPSQTLVSTQLYTGSTLEHPLHAQSPMSSQPNMSTTFGCLISPQPQVYTSSSNGSQDIFQQENQIQSGLGTSSTDFDFIWDASPSESNQQIPAGGSQIQSSVPADNFRCQTVATEDKSHLRVTVPTENSFLIDGIDFKIPGSADRDSLDFEFSSWMFENQSSPGDLEVSVPPGFNVFSPEPASLDAGTLFDF